MHHYLIISIVLFLIAVALITTALLIMKKDTFSQYKNAQDCNAYISGSAQGSACGVWDGNECRKGKITGLGCEAKGNAVPLLLAVVGAIAFITSIIFLVMHFRSK